MKLLSQEQFDRAAEFIKSQARPLERARFEFHFEDGGVDRVLAELKVFQNPDGGFGALEADIGGKPSSVLSTTIAFQIFREVKVASGHPMIGEALQYLLHAYNDEIENWPIIPEHDNKAPHAPWWHIKDGDYEAFLKSQSSDNPRPEVLGYLYDYGDDVDENCGPIRDKVTTLTINRLSELSPKRSMMHGLLCYLRLLESRDLPEKLQELLLPWLEAAFSDKVERNPDEWKNYVLRPLDVVHSPSSHFCPALREAVEKKPGLPDR